MIRRAAGVLVLAVALAAVAVGLAPRPALRAPPGPAVPGIFHVHTTMSHDGHGTLEEVVAAARDAGASFVVVTEHEKLHPDLPVRKEGVLLVPGVELSADAGHVIALGAATIPRGRGPEMLAAIAQAGGEAVLAHPVNRRRPWVGGEEGFSGYEALSLDSALRSSSPLRRALAALALLGDPPKAGALLLDRPDEALRRYDRIAAGRPITLFCGVDAHGRPAYPVSFGALRLHVDLGAARARWGGSARADAAAVLASLREGRAFCSVPALGDASSFRLRVAGGAILASVEAPSAILVLLRNGEEVARGPSPLSAPDAPGAWRAEAHVSAFPYPSPALWITSSALRR